MSVGFVFLIDDVAFGVSGSSNASSSLRSNRLLFVVYELIETLRFNSSGASRFVLFFGCCQKKKREEI